VAIGAFTCAARDVIKHLAAVLNQKGKDAPLAFTVEHDGFEALGVGFVAALHEAMEKLQPSAKPLPWHHTCAQAWLCARVWREELLRGESNDATTGLDHLQSQRSAGQQPCVLAYGGSEEASRQLVAHVMGAAGFTSVAVAAEPPLDVTQFEVAVELSSFTGHSESRFEGMTGDVPAYAFLVHSLSSVDYISCCCLRAPKHGRTTPCSDKCWRVIDWMSFHTDRLREGCEPQPLNHSPITHPSRFWRLPVHAGDSATGGAAKWRLRFRRPPRSQDECERDSERGRCVPQCSARRQRTL
jgi:hypothetical protein